MLQRRPLASVLFASPALAIYSLIIIYPLISGAILSFTNSAGGPVSNFVGLTNYAQLASDGRLPTALLVTVVFAFASVIGGNAIGLFLARALYYRPRVRKVGTFLILLPTLVAPVMAAFVFSYVFSPTGALNTVLGAVGLGGLERAWLGDPATALLSVILVSWWTSVGASALIFMSSYLNLDADVLAAASIDGATGAKRFLHVEWPLVSAALTVNLTLGTIGALRVFELPLVLTNGGPVNATRSISMLIYRELFGTGAYGFAYGVALSVVFLLLVALVASVLTTVMRRREHRMFG